MAWFRFLASLFPPSFRDQFAEDILEMAREDLDAARERGFWQAALLSARTSIDLLGSVCREHIKPSWPDPILSRHLSRLRLRRRELITRKLDTMLNDLLRAARSLRRSPGFSAAIILTLGLAIGVNAGIFTVVHRVLIEPLPFEDSERLVRILSSAPGTEMPSEFGASNEFYLRFQDSELIEDVAIFNHFTNTFRTEDRVERIRMSVPTPSLFKALRAEPILGQVPEAGSLDEDRVVLSHALWKTWFNEDPEVIGKTVHTFGRTHTVVAVMGADFWFPREDVMLWVPLERGDVELRPGQFTSALLARLKPGVMVEDLAPELRTLVQVLPERYGVAGNYAEIIKNYQPLIKPLREALVGDVRTALTVLFAAVLVVLLIACANVGNLLMVRAERKRHDLAIQRSLGASRGRLIRLQLTESLVLSVFAGFLAVAIARGFVPLLLEAAPQAVPMLSGAQVGAATLFFTAAAALITAFLCGLVPAVRGSGQGLSAVASSSGRRSTSRRGWGRTTLVVSQTALALVLLISSGLLLRSFQELRQVDAGYDIEDIYTFQMAPEGEGLTDAPSFARFHWQFLERLEALPGVESAGMIENLPLNEGVRSSFFRSDLDNVADEPTVRLAYNWTGGNLLDAMGIDLLSGRPLTAADYTTDLGNVLVSKSVAELMWPDENPLGRRLQQDGQEHWETVVGVVGDVLQNDFRGEPAPTVYRALVGPRGAEGPVISSPAYVLRTKRAEQIGDDVRTLVREVAPNAPVYRTFTMRTLAERSMVELSFTMNTLIVAAGLALLLGAIGLYGVLSFAVAERTREIGVRMALGAAPGEVRRMILTQGMRVVVIGIVVGLGAAFVATSALSSLLYGVPARDLTTFAITTGALVLVGLLATYLPARRASSVDPAHSLASE